MVTVHEVENTEYKMRWEKDTFTIAEGSWDSVQGAVKKLNKRATKLGADPVELTVVSKDWVERKNSQGVKIKTRVLTIKVDGEAPKFKGWSFIGKIDHSAGFPFITEVPGMTVPTEYRNSKANCEHCHSARRRKHTFVVRNEEGEYKEVGRTCLKDFLGGTDPRVIVWQFDFFDRLDQLVSDAEDDGWDRDHTSIRPVQMIHLEDYLAHCARMIDENGWVSSQDEGVSTAWQAMINMFPSAQELKYVSAPQPKDYVIAKETIEWARTAFEGRDDLNNYEFNLKMLLADSAFPAQAKGFVASAIPALNRAKEREMKRNLAKQQRKSEAEMMAGSVHVGNIGDKIGVNQRVPKFQIEPFNVKVLSKRSIETSYGTSYIHNMISSDGNVFVWFASSETNLEQGKEYTLTAGAVKDHTEFNDVKQTKLVRVKYEPV